MRTKINEEEKTQTTSTKKEKDKDDIEKVSSSVQFRIIPEKKMCWLKKKKSVLNTFKSSTETFVYSGGLKIYISFKNYHLTV